MLFLFCVKQTITIKEMVKQIRFDPNYLKPGTIFLFQYWDKPTIYLMKTRNGATVLGRNPQEDCGCTDYPGDNWGEESFKQSSVGQYFPFAGTINIKQQTK